MSLRVIVVIGSRNYRDRELMREILDDMIKSRGKLLIMSGKCPMEDSVDNWAITWAKENGILNLEIPPKENNKDGFFARNKEMAHYADDIIAFIPRDQFRSGTWNCINEFRKLGKTEYTVFDEDAKEWDRQWKKQ